jgi:type VI secretion system protein VasG
MNVDLKSLVSKLDDTCRSALESAAGLCLSRTNYEVDIEHLFLKLIESNGEELSRLLRQLEIDPSSLQNDLTRALERLKTGNARTPTLSPHLPKLFEEAWLLASIEFRSSKIMAGHLLLSLLVNDSFRRLASELSKEFNAISVETLKSLQHSSDSQTESDETMPSIGKQRALDQYTVDLTALAKAGKIDPVLGRDFEIRQIIDILTRRRQNNPILTGEAGVGKTAVVEGFALRVAANDVPPALRDVAVRTLDLGLLQAGAGIKGEFENRLKNVIDEVKSSRQPIILFIDEAHTMIGAGGQAGQNDAANLLKPALARGELRTIAATTWAEYKKYFEKDAALARRFQVIKVEEPSEQSAIVMMRGIMSNLEKHHGVRILDEAVEESVKLSHRYITGRQLPDKAVSVLDTACARVAIGHSSTPPSIEDARRQISLITTEIETLEKEALTGSDHSERVGELVIDRSALEERLKTLVLQWDRERAIIEDIQAAREQLEKGGPGYDEKKAELREKLTRLKSDLEILQGENPLMQPVVNSQTIAEVISGWTGIPVGKMLSDELNTVLTLDQKLEERVIGQSHALKTISRRVQTSRAELTDPGKPVGVFLLVGPSGVGKTETALTLAETLYGGERNLISINMSEYQESHTVSSLKGSPPGYVGYGEGGVLTEAVRRKPYSVLLLDEVEKAHPDVMELFYQVFDKGVLEDGEGREIDFKNTLILLTSNVATDTIMRQCSKAEARPDPEALTEKIRPELLEVFKPALLGRMVVVPYYPIADEVMKKIIRLQLARISSRIEKNHGAQFSYEDDLVDSIADRCTEVESGARNVDHILTQNLLPALSGEILSRMVTGQNISRVHVYTGEEGQFSFNII